MNHINITEIKRILEENNNLKNQNEILKNKISNFNVDNEKKKLKIKKKLLEDNICEFEHINKQNIKDEFAKYKIEYVKLLQNIDAHNVFNLPIKKSDEQFGEISSKFYKSIFTGPFEDILTVKSYNGSIVNINPDKKSFYQLKSCDKVLWNTNTKNITYIFTPDNINLPINLRELYNY